MENRFNEIRPTDFENDKIEKLDHSFLLHTYSPQFGGYHGKMFVDFNKHTDRNNCCDVKIFHDGEFPREEDGDDGIELHLCDVTQFIDKGLKVYNAMCMAQDGELDREYLTKLRDEINAMLSS